MIDRYVRRELLRKNRGVYFKRGRWIVQLILLLVLWSAFSIESSPVVKVSNVLSKRSAGVDLFFFLLFFYTYCLYLVPACFKENRYRRFWILFVLMLVTFPLADLALWHLLSALHIGGHAPSLPLHVQIGDAYRAFFSYFLGFTTMLFFMELLEGINTLKDVHNYSNQLLATERRLIKTRMDPHFVSDSLDGIVRLTSARAEDAPDAVVRFSDILRYRLYRSANNQVPLEEELQQLSNLIRFHNSIYAAEAFSALEIEGAAQKASLPPLSLINVAEPLLNLYEPGRPWDLLLYILIEDRELQMAIELTTSNPALTRTLDGVQTDLQSIFGDLSAFSVEQEGDVNSIRICLPIQLNSTASS